MTTGPTKIGNPVVGYIPVAAGNSQIRHWPSGRVPQRLCRDLVRPIGVCGLRGFSIDPAPRLYPTS
jgi:hypothetical protein